MKRKTPSRKSKIKATHRTVRRRSSKAQTSPVETGFPIVGVGASAGGLEAFEQLLGALPVSPGMALVLVQHLAPKHESYLTELLSRKTKIPVIEVREGERVLKDHIYVIPPNRTLTIENGILRLAPLESGAERRFPIDHFFRSLSEDRHAHAIGVILSGTASDGTIGLQAIKAHGGITFAQDDKTAKYTGMPHSAVAAGVVDFVLPPELIALELDRIARHIRVFASEEGSPIPSTPDGEQSLSRILALLKIVSHVDFNFYKPGTIRRRIARRMFLKKIVTLDDYVQFLRKNSDEVEALFQDVLIHVTGFFRDSDAFEGLKAIVFPRIMSAKTSSSPVRIWVPGCSTGEEAYSLAIAWLEYLGKSGSSTTVQIFATDVSDAIVQKARAGIFTQSIAADMSADRLRRFFVKVNGGYQLTKTVRDMCIFAKQDITRDPPFSKLDMISCRNVMIYLAQVLQKRIIPLFHYALRPDGILFLGSSETVSGFNNLFEPLDKKFKIYAKKRSSVPFRLDLIPHPDNQEMISPSHEKPLAGVPDLQRTAEQILLGRYAPARVMVKDNMEIVQFFGHTGAFLEPAPGTASLDLMKMVKSGLHVELRAAFQNARKKGAIRREGLFVETGTGLKTVDIEVIPLNDASATDRYYLVTFEESQTPALARKEKPREKGNTAIRRQSGDAQASKRLKEELDATREYLQSIIEEQRTTNEELRSANEEIQSTNEELQSINEELETAKEELQSTNEELTTVNEELQNRNDDLLLLNSDLNNLLSSVNIPILMLGNDLRIRRFTPVAEKMMNLIPTDVGRPITDIKPNLKFKDLKKSITDVLDTLKIEQSAVEDQNGKWYSMKIRPYRTLDNKIDGVVIVLQDSSKNE